MKKVIILVFCILLLSGCKATYNLDIDKMKYEEDINLYFEKTTEYKDQVDGLLQSAYPAFKDVNYNLEDSFEYDPEFFYKSTKIDDENYGINYHFTFIKDNFRKSKSIADCYQYFTFLPNDNGYRTLLTSDRNVCFDLYPPLEELTVNIKTNYLPSYQNADEINGNIYTWHITRENYQSHPISFRLTDNYYEEESFLASIPKGLLVAIVLFIVLFCIIALYFVFRNKKVNKI